MIKTSDFLSVNTRDIIKGCAVAAIAAVAPIITQSIASGAFVFNLTDIWHAAAAGAWGYIVLKFFTPAKVVTPAE